MMRIPFSALVPLLGTAFFYTATLADETENFANPEYVENWAQRKLAGNVSESRNSFQERSLFGLFERQSCDPGYGYCASKSKLQHLPESQETAFHTRRFTS